MNGRWIDATRMDMDGWMSEWIDGVFSHHTRWHDGWRNNTILLIVVLLFRCCSSVVIVDVVVIVVITQHHLHSFDVARVHRFLILLLPNICLRLEYNQHQHTPRTNVHMKLRTDHSVLTPPQLRQPLVEYGSILEMVGLEDGTFLCIYSSILTLFPRFPFPVISHI